MLVLWFLILSVLLVGYIVYPWLRESQPLYQELDAVDELLLERERTYTALIDLDFDYEAGKLSEADYEDLRQQLLSEAAQVLANIYRISQRKQPTAVGSRSDDLVEAAISRYKQKRKA